jgi:gp32 DNA binding protein like
MKVTDEIDIDALCETVAQENDKAVEKATATGAAQDPNFLQFKQGNTYKVRLLPYLPNKANTKLAYEECGFKLGTEPYVKLGRSPRDAGIKDDPISKVQWDTFAKGKANNDEAMKKNSYLLFPKRHELINVYVVKDTCTPENEGTVKIMRYNAAINNKTKEPVSVIFSAIQDVFAGDFKATHLKKVFRLDEAGISLNIKVGEKAGFNDYKAQWGAEEDLGLSKAQIKEIYESTFDLEPYIPAVLPADEVKQLLAEKFTAVIMGTSFGDDSDFSMDDDDDFDDAIADIETDDKPAAKVVEKKTTTKKAAKKAEPEVEFDMSDDDDLNWD